MDTAEKTQLDVVSRGPVVPRDPEHMATIMDSGAGYLEGLRFGARSQGCDKLNNTRLDLY